MLELILKFLFIILCTLFALRQLLHFFLGPEEKRAGRGRAWAKRFFRRNLARHARETKAAEDRFTALVWADRLRPYFLASLLLLAVLLLFFQFQLPPAPEKITSLPPPPLETKVVPQPQPGGLPRATSRPLLDRSGDDQLLSWTDSQGRVHYSNSKKAEGSESRETPITINNGTSILIPVTIGHRGRSLQTTMLVDTGCSSTLVHLPITQQLQPDYIKSGQSIVADGRKIDNEMVRFDLFQVGPFVEKNFTVTTAPVQNQERLDYQGLLGMAFLSKHPFQIDLAHKVIRWL